MMTYMITYILERTLQYYQYYIYIYTQGMFEIHYQYWKSIIYIT